MQERTAVREKYFQSMEAKDLYNAICGDVIGYGIHRLVMEYQPDPSCVIKFEYTNQFKNVKEWDLWSDLQHTTIKEWLAPCVWLSACGMWLVQKKTKPPPESYKLPERVPRFMTDIKPQNFGLIKGKLVCHDYANHLCVNYAISKATKKVEWF